MAKKTTSDPLMLAVNVPDLTTIPQIIVQSLFADLERVTGVLDNNNRLDNIWIVFRGPAERINALAELLKQWKKTRKCLIRHKIVTERWIANRTCVPVPVPSSSSGGAM